MTEPTTEPSDPVLSRRKILLGALGAGAAAVLAACAGDSGNDSPTVGAQPSPSTTAASSSTTTAAAPTTTAPATLAATPQCADDDDVTPAQTEGPYFKPNSPERTNIRADAGGTKLVLTGAVVTTDCKPVAHALLDFWQADAGGNYDNSGFGFRGHQYTDAQGRYQLDTVVAGLYPGRTRHIHVKVQPPGGKVLTTQLYFPNESRNASDGIFREECLMDVRDGSDGRQATFTFVVTT
jgi:protocatechuate 3,4-dioxygenase beta subunit